MQIEMTIKGLMVDPVTNMPIVILRDEDGQRVLPIWVGIFEANAIALQIENVGTPRPMTHDLLRNVISDLKAQRRRRSSCRDLQENTFYALIYLRRGRRDGGDRRAAERRHRAGAADAGADLRRGGGHRQREAGRPRRRETRRRAAAEVAREPRSGRARQVQDVVEKSRSAAAYSRLFLAFADSPP